MPEHPTTVEVRKPQGGGSVLDVEYCACEATAAFDGLARYALSDGKTYPVHPPDDTGGAWWAEEARGLGPRPVKPHTPGWRGA